MIIFCAPQLWGTPFSTHTPARGRRRRFIGLSSLLQFQSTTPVRGATFCYPHDKRRVCISTHAPRGGRPSPGPWDSSGTWNFNPRPPRGGGRQYAAILRPLLHHISTHAPARGGDRSIRGRLTRRSNFNPRPHAGGDWRNGVEPRTSAYFNPRPPHGGRRCSAPPSARQADFNPHPPHGGRPEKQPSQRASLWISTHAPRAGGDPRHRVMSCSKALFQPTPPVRGATFVRTRY